MATPKQSAHAAAVPLRSRGATAPSGVAAVVRVAISSTRFTPSGTDKAECSPHAEAGRKGDRRDMRSTAIIVHYGDVNPTVTMARAVTPFVDDVVVAVNDRSVRPVSLPADVEWLVMDRNLGYGTAFMRVAAGRDSDVLILLNNDLEISAESFRRCVETLRADARIGVVGPVLRLGDGRLQSGAARLTRFRKASRPLIDPGVRVQECEWVTGAAMFLRGDLVHRIGMDGSYFLGHEDVDFCVRVRRAGYKIVCHGGAPAVHHASQVITGPRWSYYSPRNRVWFARANFGIGTAVFAWLGELAVLPRVLLADLVKRRDLTSSRLRLLAAVHSWLPKPSIGDGPRVDEPLAGRVMRW